MITDEMVGTVAHLMTGLYGSTCCHKTGGYGGQHMVEGCECRATARAALTAVLPMIRDAALEEAAKVAEYRDPGNPFAPRDDKGQRIAAAIRAMKGTSQ